MTKTETVTIIYNHPRVLLGMKKVRFGRGKYNGFGGGLKNGESLEECAIRETQEESGLKIKKLEKIGKILFQFESDEPDHVDYFFVSTKFEGTPIESEEMKPEWFDINNIPYDRMWSDDKYWLPLLLEGKKFEGNFHFDLTNRIKNYQINEVNSLS